MLPPGAGDRAGRASRIAAIDLRLDTWIADPTIRVAHRRTGRASVEELWQAAQTVRLADTQMLGRLVRWRIPGLDGSMAYDEMFRRPPFVVLDEGEHHLLSGIVGRIWTLRRDYPTLDGPEAFRAYCTRGTVRVLFASWAQASDEAAEDTRAELCSEVRVEAFGRQGRLGLATVRPLVRGFAPVIGTDGIAAAVRQAERAKPRSRH